jgi:hypothetical protein
MVYRFFALNMIQYWFDYVQNIIFIYISVHLCNPSLSWNERLSWLGNCSSLAPHYIKTIAPDIPPSNSHWIAQNGPYDKGFY